jgi:hypothetical protein
MIRDFLEQIQGLRIAGVVMHVHQAANHFFKSLRAAEIDVFVNSGAPRRKQLSGPKKSVALYKL